MELKQDQKLQRHLDKVIDKFEGEIGFYVKDLSRNTYAATAADAIFPTASIVKIPILLGIMEKIINKKLDYHQDIVYTDSLLYEGSDILGSFKDKQTISLAKVIMLMLTTSDNTASLWLQGLAGGGQQINGLLDRLGYPNTRVNSRTPGRTDAQVQYGWGQTTPREMAQILEGIVTGKTITPEASHRMLRCLGRNYWDEEALSQIPPNIFVASKNGAVNQSRSEVVYVNAPHHPYIFSVFTRNQVDQSWTPQNAGWVVARAISRELWHYFEPNHKWKAAELGSEESSVKGRTR